MIWLVVAGKAEATSLVVLQAPTATDAGQVFEVEVEFSTSVKNTNYYLLGMFSQSEGSNSFGLTRNNAGELVDSTASPSSYYLITTDGSGHWQGKMAVVANKDDSGFKGQGDYLFKVNRYTGKSANPAESSNVVTIKLLYTPPPTPVVTPSPTPLPSTTPAPTLSPTLSPTPSPEATSKPATPKPKKAELNFFQLAPSATESSQSASSSGQIKGTSIELPNTNYVPVLFMIGGLSLAAGLISLVLKIWPN